MENRDNFSHQDWKPVTWKKKAPPAPKETRKPSGQPSALDDEPKNTRKITTDARKLIQQERLARGWSQRDLAQRINVRPEVIRDYENGSALPSGAVTQKLTRVLNIKLSDKIRKF